VTDPCGFLDVVSPRKSCRALCSCSWVSAPVPTARDARTEFETHYRDTHQTPPVPAKTNQEGPPK
jgi:hypothetical protein